MLQINGKTFMNLQEAVQWLLDNNALPFQSSANYIANTEIGLGTIVNPSPAKVRIGSLILFADSKIATVTGLTNSGFLVGSQYVDAKNALNYIANVAINASQHLIVTFSDGSTIDAGFLKQLNYFGIDASQHLIAYYNDGTSTDLGAIFSGNVNIAGNLTADSIIENMTGYSFTEQATSLTIEKVYAGIVKNGNKLTLVYAFNATRTGTIGPSQSVGYFTIPWAVAGQLYPSTIGGYSNCLAFVSTNAIDEDRAVIALNVLGLKNPNNIELVLQADTINNLNLNKKAYVRIELTFLLSDNLAS